MISRRYQEAREHWKTEATEAEAQRHIAAQAKAAEVKARAAARAAIGTTADWADYYGAQQTSGVVSFWAGTVQNAAEALVDLERITGKPARMEFNGKELVADGSLTAVGICRKFHADLVRR